MVNSSEIAPGDCDRSHKTISYMWYIHVSVKVNTEDRLRDHTAPFLQRNAPSYLPSPSVACASFPEEHCDLTDHLVLRYLDNEILGRLVDTMPLFKHADAYAGIPEDVPERFREVCCRRPYVLLLTRRIVEWPSGIDVPHTGAAAGAEPLMVSAAASTNICL